MGRGTIQRILLSTFLLCLAFPAWPAEFRGLWVDAFGPGFYDSGQVSNLVSDCRKYNFNAVIVEMRNRGNAFYTPHPPNGDIRRSTIDTNFDALAEIVRQCHNGNPRIEVHCWAVAQLVWSSPNKCSTPEHISNLHPEYLTKDSVGQTYLGKGYFLDPGHPDACQWNYNTAIDIVSHYDIDGFHWDYLRYPNQDSGYNETALARYNAEFRLTGQPSPKDSRFSAWRRRQVTDFLRWVDADLLALRPKLVISASVFANYPDAFGYRFQEWAAWNREGIIDLAMPMDFSTNNSQVFSPRVDFALTNQGNRRVYIGQAAYLNHRENTLTQLQYAKKKGFEGYCLYSYRIPNSEKPDQPETFDYLKQNYQPTWISAPALPWKTNPASGIIRGTVTDRQSGKPVYNAVIMLDNDPKRLQQTEPHGKYAFFETTPGTHTVAVKTSSHSGVEKVIVIAGAVTTLDLKVEPLK